MENAHIMLHLCILKFLYEFEEFPTSGSKSAFQSFFDFIKENDTDISVFPFSSCLCENKFEIQRFDFRNFIFFLLILRLSG